MINQIQIKEMVDFNLNTFVCVILFSLLLGICKGESFSGIKSVEIPSDLPIDSEGFVIEHKEAQLECIAWVIECIKERKQSEVINQINPGFERTLFGQTVLRTLTREAGPDEFALLEIVAHCLKYLREDKDPFVLIRGRNFLDNWSAQRNLVHATASVVGEHEFEIKGRDVSNSELEGLATLIQSQIRHPTRFDDQKLLQDSLEKFNSFLPIPVEADLKIEVPKPANGTAQTELPISANTSPKRFWPLFVGGIALLIMAVVLVRKFTSQ